MGPLVLCLLLVLSGCAGSVRPPAREPHRREVVTAVAPTGVPMYDTRPAPRATRGDGDANRIERVLLEIAKERKLELEGDGRLAALGEYILSGFVPSGRPPPTQAIDAAARRLGLVAPIPFYSLFTARDDATLRDAINEMLGSVPANLKFNRYGIVAAPSANAVLLSETRLELDPVPRRAEPGHSIVLRGELGQGRTRARLDVTTPDGTVQSLGQSKSSKIDFVVPLATRGVHRIELLADGPNGLEVVANFPVFVGVVEPDPAAAVTGGGDELGASAGAPALVARLLELLNEARGRAGAPNVALHEGLSAMAEAHSRDMVDRKFFGHTSDENGDPLTRMQRAGLALPTVAENIGRGGTAEEVHRMLLDSPGHRANALNAAWSVVGIGVAIDSRGREPKIVVTEEFGGVSSRIEPLAARGLVLDAVNRKRIAAGSAKLAVDPTLAAIAQAGAARFFAEPGVGHAEVLEGLDRLIGEAAKRRPAPFARLRATQSGMVVVAAIDQVPLDSALDPAVRLIGIGVAQGTRGETGPNAIAVVIVIGWPK